MTKQKPPTQEGNLTLAQKAQIVTYSMQQIKVNHVAIAKWATDTFKLSKPLSRSTVSRIISRKHDFQNLTDYERVIKHRRPVTNLALETVLKNWMIDMQGKKGRLTVGLIKLKAQTFAEALGCVEEFKFSNGWYESFCKRNGFKGFKIHGESGDAQMEGIKERVMELRAKIASYSLNDVYNMDEIAYLYNFAPDKTIAQRQIEGAKKDKTRLTIAVTCNATGSDRVELMILGHAQKPRCFHRKSGAEHGFFYLSNKKAWMTGDFFRQYLHRLNFHVGRRVFLIIDNAPSHIWNEDEFPNLDIVALPPNTTSKLQPLDAGIIAAFKCQIRKQQLAHALDVLKNSDNPNPYKVDQLTAMRWAKRAWRNLDDTVIRNCWKHTGLLDVPEHQPQLEVPINVDISVDQELRQDYELFISRANIRDAMAIDNFLNPAVEKEILREIEAVEFEESLLQVAETTEIDEEQEEVENEVMPLYSDLPKQEQIKALAVSIGIYERENNPRYETREIVGALRAVQRKIRWEIEAERNEKQTQLSISRFFG